jgi:fructose-1,6-bisphosphatase/inositol monophosphatase family enzyme
VDDDELLGLLEATADDVAGTLARLDDWAPAGTRPGQYRSDLNADAVAVARLTGAGLGVLSEESGWHDRGAGVVVVVDPLDGSTNASRRIPWYATSLCALDADGPRVAVVLNLASHQRFTAVRGRGAHADGKRLRAEGPTEVGEAIVGLSGWPSRPLGWRQFRALGAVALDLCAVASGALDGYVDCSPDAHGSWDYLGGLLVCREAGAAVADAHGRDLVALEHADRRTPVAGATPALLAGLLEARRALDAS